MTQAVSALSFDELVQEDRVHRSLYTDRDVFRLELERIFERTWVFVGHETEVPEPCDYKTVVVGRQPMILTRDKSGDVNVLLNRCMHRGALVCNEAQGNSSLFQCIYHGWTYDNTGALKGVPFRHGYGGAVDFADLHLRRPECVESYRGFVFAAVNDPGIGLEEHLGNARKYLDAVIDSSPRGTITVRSGSQKFRFPANWKLQVENLVDGYHPTFTHQIAFEIRDRKIGRRGSGSREGAAKTRALGNGHAMLDFTGSRVGLWASLAGRNEPFMESLRAAYGEDGATSVIENDVHLLVFPNLFIQKDRQHFRVIRPLAADACEIRAYAYTLDGAPDELNEKMVTMLAWWASPAGFGQPDDVEAFTRCQQGFEAAGADWVLFARGLHREVELDTGEVEGDITDELPQRRLWEHWKRLMQDGQP